MTENLAKAPITEAVIDFRISPHLDGIDSLNVVQSELVDKYPKYSEITYSRIELKDGSASVSKPIHPVGYRLESDDKLDVLFVSLDGLALSRIDKYEGGDTLLSKFFTAWDKYKINIDANSLISRIGLRYINKFSIPASNYGEFLKLTIPILAGETPMVSSTTKIVVSQLPFKAIVNLHVALSPHNKEELDILFDIDAFQDDLKIINQKNVCEHVHKLREFKNGLFFNNLTDKCLELFR